jgi:arylsulfatase A-like enzyme
VQRVLIVSFDGLRPDGLLRAQIPFISSMINEGASSFTAQMAYPPSTLPGHSSMLSGRCVAKHGITWNDYIPANGYIQGPTVFSVAHDAGLRTVMVVGKEKLVTIARPGTVDSFRYISGSDEQTVQTALEESAAGFGVLFIHFFLPDYAGHLDGWMSASYLNVIGRDDSALGTLLDGLRARGLMDGTLVILSADHGGHDFSHATNSKEDVIIPWIAYGPGIVPGFSLTVPVSVTDTAATAVWALGLDLPADWDGRPVVEAFGLSAEQAGVSVAAPDRCGP